MNTLARPFKICAVNYLNTVPLVWGMLHGPEQEQVDLTFAVPSKCAETVDDEVSEIGLAPIAEISRRRFEIVPGLGIACRGAVRSILLISRKPIKQIETLAIDLGSRTSVELARVILREMYGVTPSFHRHPPALERMLASHDAALLIGDAALKVDPYLLPHHVLDLGAEWYALTGLPMVFALWAGRNIDRPDAIARLIDSSYRFGQSEIKAIIDGEWNRRGISRDLTNEYLTRYIHYEIGDEEWRGAEAFLELAGLQPVSEALAQTR